MERADGPPAMGLLCDPHLSSPRRLNGWSHGHGVPTSTPDLSQRLRLQIDVGGLRRERGPPNSVMMASSAPDPEHPSDNLRTVTVQPKSSRSMNPPGRPTPPANLFDDQSSVRESPAPKGEGKSKGKPKGEKGKGDKGGSDKGKAKERKGESIEHVVPQPGVTSVVRNRSIQR